MRIVIAAVGKGRGSAAQALHEDYAARLPWPVELKEIEARRASGGPGATKLEEGRLILRALPEGATLIALDPAGTMLTSEAFAGRLKALQDGGTKLLCFAIGGADGLDAAVLKAARFKLSFGAMTWPHLLARAMLAEQLYRAATIIAGHPYHRG